MPGVAGRVGCLWHRDQGCRWARRRRLAPLLSHAARGHPSSPVLVERAWLGNLCRDAGRAGHAPACARHLVQPPPTPVAFVRFGLAAAGGRPRHPRRHRRALEGRDWPGWGGDDGRAAARVYERATEHDRARDGSQLGGSPPVFVADVPGVAVRRQGCMVQRHPPVWRTGGRGAAHQDCHRFAHRLRGLVARRRPCPVLVAAPRAVPAGHQPPHAPAAPARFFRGARVPARFALMGRRRISTRTAPGTGDFVRAGRRGASGERSPRR
mmetsp:Transcript_33265/g.107593  ORF Transcript_33265/g.107593 Transcript_33265/m.107593 type:complete len:267 (-) Transcript_33265:1756-2556(-)